MAEILTDQKEVQKPIDKQYASLLNQIDLKLTKEETTQKETQKINIETDQFPQNYGSFSIKDLINNAEGQNLNTSQIKQHLIDYSQNKNQIQEPTTIAKQEAVERKVNYKQIYNYTKKWLPIIKKNRESDTLDFRNKDPRDFQRMQNVETSIKRNEIAEKMDKKLLELNLQNEEQVIKKENEILEQLTPQQMKERMNELAKQRSILFAKELKNKRMAKIKSKLYHKIKKKVDQLLNSLQFIKQKMIKQQLRNMEKIGDIDPNVWKEELENIKRERAEERIKQRHNTKSRYVKSLLRFGGNSKQIQQSINDVNKRRQELLKKITENQMKNVDDVDDDEVDDQEFKEGVMHELEEQFLGNKDEEEKKNGLMGLKFMQRYVGKQEEVDRQEAGKLMAKLKQNRDLDEIFSENDLEEEERDSDNENQEETDKKYNDDNNQKNFEGKKTYIKQVKGNDLILEETKLKPKIQSTEKILTSFINKHKAKDNEEMNNEETQKEDEANQEQKEKPLESGINVKNLISKYNKQLNVKLSEKDIQKFKSINQDEQFENFSNFKILNTNLNQMEFEQEKDEEVAAELPAEQSKLKGWGRWAGQGITERQQPSPEELLQRKREAIEKKKQQRRDFSMDNVIINEKRVKPVSQYLIPKLPFEYKNKEQFDYVNNVPLGSEWNSSLQHKKLTMPKIITQAGEMIRPIQHTVKKIKKK